MCTAENIDFQPEEEKLFGFYDEGFNHSEQRMLA